MGNMRACGMAEAVRDGQITLRVALYDHLISNHYPSVDPAFVDTALAAISKVDGNEDDHEIAMPNGITKTAAQIVDGLHLEPFVDCHGSADELEGGR